VSRLPRPTHRWLVVAAAGILLVLGALMLVLPGPGLLLIGAALALLAGEFPSVRDRLHLAATIASALRAGAARMIRFGQRPDTGG
jgi:Putative transmembrane protein (PGPGW)